MARETGWLIESHNQFPATHWLRVMSFTTRAPFTAKLDWSTEADLAIRFARESDAIDFAKLHPDFCQLARPVQHLFVDMDRSTDSGEAKS